MRASLAEATGAERSGRVELRKVRERGAAVVESAWMWYDLDNGIRRC